MEGESLTYFRSLDLGRQHEYMENTWGARPVVALDFSQLPNGHWVAVASCGLVNFILAAELSHPAPAVVVQRMTARYSANDHLTSLLVAWDKNVREALRSE